jgi:G3E family GTPase
MMAPLTTFRIEQRAAAERLPVTLITGFLGSGKTTLVNHILANRQGVRAAVLVNEIGALGIDQDLIIAADGAVALSNGCICCSINNDLVGAIAGILMRPEPVEHLIIETSGAADPLPVALTCLRSEFRGALRLDGILALADAEQFSLESFDGLAARRQLRYADAILLNKCDLAPPSRRDQVEAWLRDVNPDARIYRTEQSRAPLPLILDMGESALQGGLQCDAAPPGHLQADQLVTLSFESAAPLALDRFQAFLDFGRPAGLFRAKGFLRFAETGRSHLFHLVGSRFSLDEADRPADGRSRLVCIGRGFDEAALRARLLACVTDAAAAPGGAEPQIEGASAGTP